MVSWAEHRENTGIVVEVVLRSYRGRTHELVGKAGVILTKRVDEVVAETAYRLGVPSYNHQQAYSNVYQGLSQIHHARK